MKLLNLKKYILFANGFSVVELLVATAVSILLLTSSYTLYLSVKKTHLIQQGVARIQENGRLAVQFLAEDIKATGFIGCSKWEDVVFTNHATEQTGMITPQYSLIGYSAEQKDKLPQAIASRVVPGTDVIITTKATSKVGYLREPMASNITLKVDPQPVFKPGQLVMLADCSSADLFKIQNVDHEQGQQIITASAPLAKLYTTKASISRFESIAYFVARSNTSNSLGHSINALYRKDLFGDENIPDASINGVDSIKINYGVDARGEGYVTEYQPANGVKSWHQVVSVEIALLLNSVEPLFETSKIFKFNGNTYIAADNRLYREWNTYIALRQRLSASVED